MGDKEPPTWSGSAHDAHTPSCLLGWSLFLAVGVTLFGFVETQDDLFPDRVHLQDDVVAFPVFVRESGSDVEPVVVLLGTLTVPETRSRRSRPSGSPVRWA